MGIEFPAYVFVVNLMVDLLSFIYKSGSFITILAINNFLVLSNIEKKKQYETDNI